MSHHVLQDGYQSLISFSLNGSVHLYQKTVTPPGYDAGGEVDTTTLLNQHFRTRNPKQLVTLTESTLNVAYDPALYQDLAPITGMIGQNQQITITFSDLSTIEFWGWVDKFTPGEMSEGNQPMATVTIIPSNHDNSYNEQAPVIALS